MDFSSLSPVAMIVLLIGAATPILLAALGELVVEKSGVLNLGVEGMMIIGAVCGFIVAVNTDSPMLGLLGAAVGGAVVSMLFAFLTQYLLSNQVATGLALTLFGLGLAALMGSSYNGIRPPRMARLDIDGLTDLPIVGKLFFSHDPVIYGSLVLVVAVWYFLNRTRAGLVLRACGENHDAAHSLGYNVQLIRFGAIMFGGACAGVGGAYVSLVRVPQWTEGMTAGVGWIALAIVVFAAWKPWRVILGAYMFGGLTILQLSLQALGINISGALLSMTPYIVTIVVLVIMSADRKKASLNAPACLGKSFHASH
jgi:simple sugar transport system permease protein